MNDFVESVEARLVDAAAQLGLSWGPTPPELFFFRRPLLHVAEFVVFHLFCLFCHRLAPTFYHDNVARKPAVGKPWSALDAALGVVYLMCWVSQVVFKAMRPSALIQLCWLLMPCHLITLLWAYIFLSRPAAKNFHLCVYLATLAAAFHWGPTSAVLFPDFGDHQYPIEGLIFIIHHALLVITPVYFAARYGLLPMTRRFLAHATMVATIINVGPYTVVSYITGLNLNYHLHPPPALITHPIFATQFYRFIVIAGLIALSVACWAASNALGLALRAVLRLVAPSLVCVPAAPLRAVSGASATARRRQL